MRAESRRNAPATGATGGRAAIPAGANDRTAWPEPRRVRRQRQAPPAGVAFGTEFAKTFGVAFSIAALGSGCLRTEWEATVTAASNLAGQGKEEPR